MRTLIALSLLTLISCGEPASPPPASPSGPDPAEAARLRAEQRVKAQQAQKDNVAASTANADAVLAQRDKRRATSTAQSETATAGTSCADLAALDDKAAAAADPDIAAIYKKAADDRRAANGERVCTTLVAAAQRMQAAISAETFASADNPDGTCDGSGKYPLASCNAGPGPSTMAPAFRAQVESLKCYLSPEKLATFNEIADVMSKAVDERTAKETACRAAPDCLGPRLATRICALQAQSAELKKGIAQERANPGGVVDVVKLHDWGGQVQDADAAAKNLRAYYQATIKKPVPRCP